MTIRPQDLGNLLTVDQAAAQIGVGRATIYRLMDAGELEFTHVGKGNRRRITSRSVLDYLNKNNRAASRNSRQA